MKDLFTNTAIKVLKKSELSEHFEFSNVLGAGGFGTVVKAWHAPLSRHVAVKLVRVGVDADVYARFDREARLLSSLCHPNIARVYSYGPVKDTEYAYLVMEYVDGVPLNQLVGKFQREGRADAVSSGVLSEDRFKAIFLQAAEALAVLHAHDIIHRDIKPDNVLYAADGQGVEQVKLVDFGLAKCIAPGAPDGEQKVTKDREAVGTPMYMSPEQCWAKPTDTRSDIYSLGCVMYELATGTPPFESDNPYEMMMWHSEAAPEPLCSRRAELAKWSKVQHFQNIIDRCLAKLPDERFNTPKNLIEALSERDAEAPVRPAGKAGLLRSPAVIGCVLAVCSLAALGFHKINFKSGDSSKSAQSSRDLFREVERIRSQRGLARLDTQLGERFLDGATTTTARDWVAGYDNVRKNVGTTGGAANAYENRVLVFPVAVSALEADRLDHLLNPKQRSSLSVAACEGWEIYIARHEDAKLRANAAEKMRATAEQALMIENQEANARGFLVGSFIHSAFYAPPRRKVADAGYGYLKQLANSDYKAMNRSTLRLANLYLLIGEPKMAQQVIKDLWQESVDSYEYKTCEGTIALCLGNNVDAERHLQECATLKHSLFYPTSEDIVARLLCRTYLRLGKRQKAVEVFKSRPANAPADVGLAVLFNAHEGRWQEVAAGVEQITGLNKVDPTRYYSSFADLDLADIGVLTREGGQSELSERVRLQADQLNTLARQVLN